MVETEFVTVQLEMVKFNGRKYTDLWNCISLHVFYFKEKSKALNPERNGLPTSFKCIVRAAGIFTPR